MQSLSNPLISRQAVILVAAAAVLAPLIGRLFSPVVLILLSPIFVVLLLLGFVISNVLLSFALDVLHPRQKSDHHLRSAAKPFAFTTPAAWQAVLTRSQWSYSSPHNLAPLVPESPQVSAALNELLILIVRDFVLSWYTSISQSPAFPASVSVTLHDSTQNLLSRIEKLDLPALLVRRVLPKIIAHVDQFRESEKALRGAGLERRVTQSDELDLLLAGRYAGRGGRLHPAVDNLSSMLTRPSEEAHLRSLVDRVLPLLLPPNEAGSRAVHVAAREIVTCVVFAPIMEMFGDPDFWNRTIDLLAGAAIRQQKLISKVRHLLDTPPNPSAGLIPGRAIRTSKGVVKSENITSRTGARHFDAFLRSIGRCDSLLDARRLKNDVVGEIRRTQTLLDSHPNESKINGERAEDVSAYLERLYTAKRKVEKRIVILGGADDSGQSIVQGQMPLAPNQLTLRDVLSSPNSLSYFMEFMDRRHRALLVQFWLTVETFKDPLESVDSASETEELARALSSNTVAEDMKMIYELYFSNSYAKSPLSSVISQRYVDAIRSYVLDPTANPDTPQIQGKKARQTVLLAQRQVEVDIEDDFNEFKRSELWFRVTNELLRNIHISAPVDNRDDLPGPSRRPLPRPTLSTPAARRSGLRAPDTVRSRIYPTFILPTNSVDAASSLSEDSTTSHRPRPRVLSVESDIGFQSVRPSPPSLSNSIESLPAPNSKPFNNALEFLVADVPSPSTSTRAPLFDDPEITREENAQAERMEALQAALTDLIDEDRLDRTSPKLGGSDSGGTSRGSPYIGGRRRELSAESPRTPLPGRGSSSLQQLFEEIPMSPTSEVSPDAQDDDTNPEIEEEDESTSRANVHIAPPGDLQLSHDIARLTDKIGKLQSQEVLLEALTRKAELTGDTAELKLLSRSKSSLAKEIREMTFQKTQYEQQETENRLIPGRTRVFITSSVATENEGKQVVRYLVEIQQLSPERKVMSGWVVSRRYNEFFAMHQRLKERYTLVKNLDFPGKRLVTSLSSSFVDTRRAALEKYLQKLILIPLVCESDELRAFLSRQSTFNESGQQIVPKTPISFPGHDIVRTVYRSVAESIDDMIFGPSMLDIMIQRLSRQAAEFAGIVGSGVHDEDLIANAVKSPDETLLQLPGDLKALEGEASVSSFTAPICDLILSVFELDEKKNWLRRQAVVVILQQVLGTTIERKLRDLIKTYVDEVHLLSYLNMFRENLWPGGHFRTSSLPRTMDERAKSRDDAHRKLSTLMPDLAANMIGRTNARRGARRIFAVLQNRRLNQHLIYTVLDEIFDALFPDAPISTTPNL